MDESRKKLNDKSLWVGITFGIIFMVLNYKLADPSLWFDETIEYWYSKHMFGAVPGGRNMANMYERIVSTFQPPLYNFLMFFWLKIHDSQWWFRFFGVPMGVIGAAGVYKTIEKEINYQAGCIVALVLVTTRQYLYYTQECAEYCMLLAALPWLFYSWLCLMEEYTDRKFAAFVFFSVISIYSQYGAIFPVAILALVSYAYILYKRNKKNIRNATLMSVTAMVVAVLPLWIFFFQKQIMNQQERTIHAYVAQNKFYLENLEAWITVFNFNFELSWRWAVIILLVCITTLVLTKSKKIRWIGAVNILCWLAYFMAVKFKFYNYGRFGNRHSLFFLPIWTISITLYMWDLKDDIFEYARKLKCLKLERFLLNKKMIANGILVSVAICLIYNGWETIKPHWIKEDIRSVTKKWYEEGAYNIDTLVYYASDAGFSYYVKDLELPVEPKITIMDWYKDKTSEEYREHISELYNGNIPDELYLIGISLNDFKTIIQSFVDQGYEATDVFWQSGGRLVYFKLADAE